MPDNTPTVVLDDETAAALTLFNTYVTADRERQQHERRLKKAEKAKNDAAAEVRRLERSRGSTEASAAAEAAYRDATEAWKRLRDGADPRDARREPTTDTETETTTDTDTDTDTTTDPDTEAETEGETEATDA